MCFIIGKIYRECEPLHGSFEKLPEDKQQAKDNKYQPIAGRHQ
jgi:hypothetical protein